MSTQLNSSFSACSRMLETLYIVIRALVSEAFQDDPEWQTVRNASEANGKIVEKVDSTFMALTDFSPALK